MHKYNYIIFMYDFSQGPIGRPGVPGLDGRSGAKVCEKKIYIIHM